MSDTTQKASSKDRPSWILKPFFILAFLGLALVPWFGMESLHIIFKVLISGVFLAVGFGFYYMLWIRDPEKDLKDLPRWLEPLGWVLLILGA